MINSFDTITSWVIMNIVTQKVDKTRAKTITWFITLLSELFTIRNYIGCLAMLAALNSAPVSRLRATFLLVPKKSVKIFSAISDELSPDKNYKKLRDLQQSHIDQGLSFVPYFGLALQDLNFISDGIPSKRAEDEKINWHKNELVYKVLCGCFGLLPYDQLKPNDGIQAKFKSLSKTSDKIEYAWSLHVEPRPGGDHPAKPDFDWTPI